MKQVLLALVAVSTISVASTAQEPATADTARHELTDTITVVGEQLTQETKPFPFEKDRFNQVLSQAGFSIINKGVFLAQDVQADGYKRDDIAIVIDGERYHCACPNRMDSPLSRTNSLEMNSILLDKTSSGICSGIGGCVSFQRASVQTDQFVTGGLSQSIGAASSSDIGLVANANHHRLALRYATGEGYDDPDGKSFVDRYGYIGNNDYLLAEGSITGRRGAFEYRGEFTYTEDIMFPYLHMDERLNRVFAGSVKYRGHKLYANFTDHIMDNELRNSPMNMVTEAQNLTVGLVGSDYELYYRNWKADNRMVTPMTKIVNDLMPEVNQLAGAVSFESAPGRMKFWIRGGISRFWIGETERASFYEGAHGDVTTDRTFFTWASGLAARRSLGRGLTGTFGADFIQEAPFAQSLYITVQRPMGKAWWSGNPELNPTLRATVRGSISAHDVTLEASASRLWDYVTLTGFNSSGRNYRSYENVEAVMLSAALKIDWDYLILRADYTWAERTDLELPIEEIPPFRVTSTLTSPELRGAKLFARHTYNDAQTRVNELLSETPTSSWHQLDLGAHYNLEPFRFNLEITNITDEMYTQHLSYLRNPFASGLRVFEPGRTIRLNVVAIAGS